MSRRLIVSLVAGAAALAACSSHKTAGAPSTTPTAGAGSTSSASQPGAPSQQDSVSANATEINPAGDIPDSTVFVPYRGSGYVVSVPEGWAQQPTSTGVSFTDKLNSVTLASKPASTPPTVASAQQQTVPQLKSAAPKFALKAVTTVQRKAGNAVEIRYLIDSGPSPITGKVVRDDVQRYEFFKGGTEVDITLAGPVNADNVDPWRTITDSFKWQ